MPEPDPRSSWWVAAGRWTAARTNAPLAEELANNFTVINYDRRGRGESGDTAPYAIEREFEDIAALIDQVGGQRSCTAYPPVAQHDGYVCMGETVRQLLQHAGVDEMRYRSGRTLCRSGSGSSFG